MKKTIILSEDGFIRATEIRKYLEEGWTVTAVPGTTNEFIVEKADLNEDRGSGPQLLLD